MATHWGIDVTSGLQILETMCDLQWSDWRISARCEKTQKFLGQSSNPLVCPSIPFDLARICLQELLEHFLNFHRRRSGGRSEDAVL